MSFEIRAEDGSWRVFTGNEIGVLLGHYQIQKYLLTSPSAEQKAAVLTTVVSSRMLKTIAEKEGVHYAATLTGWKLGEWEDVYRLTIIYIL